MSTGPFFNKASERPGLEPRGHSVDAALLKQPAMLKPLHYEFNGIQHVMGANERWAIENELRRPQDMPHCLPESWLGFSKAFTRGQRRRRGNRIHCRIGSGKPLCGGYRVRMSIPKKAFEVFVGRASNTACCACAKITANWTK